MNDSVNFQVVYAGPSLDNNEMDVRELTPALISIADLLEETNNVINGGSTKVKVNVHGSFKSGSFGIDFILVQTPFQEILDLFSSNNVTAAANLITLVGFLGAGTKGLIWLLRKMKNRAIQKLENIDEDRVQITITSEEIFEIDPRVISLYKNQKIRYSLEKIISEPLSKEGITECRISTTKENKPVIVNKEEKEYYAMPIVSEEILGENINDAFLQVVNIAFKEDNKWRFSRGNIVFYATILDKEFLTNIDHHEVMFRKDDIFKVSLLTKDFRSIKGIRTEYFILKVLEHRSSVRQLPLPKNSN
ncbi:MAG: hypothetical protein ACYDH1_18455 [Anaerolineaceae bacterium]